MIQIVGLLFIREWENSNVGDGRNISYKHFLLFSQ